MKKTKLLFVVIMILSVLFVPACGDSIVEEPFVQKTYDSKIDYIGNNLTKSENVKNITEYASIEAYAMSDIHNDILWIEEEIFDFDAETVKSFCNKIDRVIVLSNTSKDVLIKQITGADSFVTETQADDSTFLGVLFTDIDEVETKDAIGLFAVKKEGSSCTDFLAFCSEYDYKARYQNENMITKYQQTQKLYDVFNVYNLNEKVYSVSYMTTVDFTNNPTQNANKTKYMYTIWSYNDVIPVNNKVSGFDAIVNVDKESYTVSYSPENDREFVKNENVSANFFYGRYYTASYDTPSDGIIKALYKGFGDTSAGWQISLLSGKKQEINYVYGSVNITGLADFISLSGEYTPSCKVIVQSIDKNGTEQSLEFGYNTFAWALKYDSEGK